MSLMLVNPRKRKSGRSAAQKAATRRMLAANRSRRSNPAKRTKRRTALRSNPVGLSRVRHAMRRTKRRSNPSLRGMLGSAGGIGGMLMNSLKGAGGAVVVNAATHYLPVSLTTGKLVYVTRAAIAIALGTFGRKLLGSNARIMAEGALTVNFHDAINSVAGTMLPGNELHGVGEYMNGGMGMLPQPGTQAHGVPFDSELSGTGEYLYR